MYAAEGGNLDVVKFLIEKGLDVRARSKSGWTALFSASAGGNLDVVKFLVEEGLDAKARDKIGGTVLMAAALSGNNPEVVRLLIDKGADVNAQDSLGWTALMVAAYQGKLEIVKLLIEKGADVNAQENTDLDRLSAFLLSIARALKHRDPSHLGRDPRRTALDIAQEKGHKEIVEYLKAHGAKE
jgi:ankyrin repeat protein